MIHHLDVEVGGEVEMRRPPRSAAVDPGLLVGHGGGDPRSMPVARQPCHQQVTGAAPELGCPVSWAGSRATSRPWPRQPISRDRTTIGAYIRPRPDRPAAAVRSCNVGLGIRPSQSVSGHPVDKDARPPSPTARSSGGGKKERPSPTGSVSANRRSEHRQCEKFEPGNGGNQSAHPRRGRKPPPADVLHWVGLSRRSGCGPMTYPPCWLQCGPLRSAIRPPHGASGIGFRQGAECPPYQIKIVQTQT